MPSGPTPRAVDGRLDLTEWDLEGGGDVGLIGTWEICWGRLLDPGDPCPSPWRPVPVPGMWSEEGAGSPFGAYGVATYRLRIDLPPGEDRLTVVAGGPYSASRTFVDGVERGSLGVVGTAVADTQMGVRNRVYDITTRADRVDLLVQVANFEFRAGGLRRSWFIGRHDSIQRGLGAAILREGMVFSVGVLVGLAYLVLFALGPSEVARGYFGLCSLVLGLRAVPASISGFGPLLASWAGFELLTRLEYLGTALAIFGAAGYAQTKVEGVVPPRIMKGIRMVALAMGAIVVIAPFSVVLATLPLQYALPVLLMILFIGGYGRAWYRGVRGVRVSVLGGSLYLLVILHDIARTMETGVGAPVELYPYGMVLWILIEGYELMRRFYQTFVKVESLSGELSEANFELQEAESAIVRFVPFDFLRLLGKRSILDVGSGDHVRSRMSVLRCGLRRVSGGLDGATAESEFDLVGRLVARSEPIVRHRGGFVNEFRGDGFQAFFPGGPQDAVAAAIEIVEEAGRLGSGASAGRATVGIDTGPVLVGTIGGRDHLLRGVVGPAVEAAGRIESLADRLERPVLISAATRSELGTSSGFEIGPVDDPLVEGVGSGIDVYEVRIARGS
jgi:class 3 adenylate cyclase